jgi:hypothetical protein
MPLEACQMLCTAHRVLDGSEYTELSKAGRKIKRWRHPNKFLNKLLYQATHVNHPSAAWVRQSNEHYRWTHDYFIYLCNEFSQRQGKLHKCFEVFADYLYHPPSNIPSAGFCAPPTAINDEWAHLIVPGDVVQSYRNYYDVAKRRLHAWKQNRPPWITELEI